MMHNNRIISGFFWKLLERFSVSGIHFLLQIILARLLSPEHYGILSIMLIFIALANEIIQKGFSAALIQNKDVTEDDYSSVLWVSLGMALLLYLAVFACAPVIARYYRISDLVTPLRVLALMIFPGALNSVQLAKVSREMDFRKVFYSNIGGVVVSGAVGILIAYLGGGLWALVTQTLLNIVVACAVMYFTVHMKIRPACNFKRIKVLLAFGWKLLVSSLFESLSGNLSGLIIGKKYNSETLGYYNRGEQFPQFIINAVNSAVQSIMLPAMSAEQDDRIRVKTIMQNSLLMSSYLIIPMMVGLAAIAEPLVRLLLTDKWLPCVPYMQIFCLSMATYPVHSCNLQAINAVGRSDIFLKQEIIKILCGFVTLAVAVFCFKSPLAIAAAGIIDACVSWFINAFPNKKLIDYSCKDQFADLLPLLMMSLVMYACVWMAGILCASFSDIVTISIQIMIGIAVCLGISILFKPRPFLLLLTQLKSLLKR
ncbi:MAG: lipopolysaccharide biosynthesis protein [Faecousia sp.]